jgi:hypothetical protein
MLTVKLRSNMHQLAFELQQLDRALPDAYVDRPSFQRQIADSIQNIERIGRYIQETDLAVTRNPVLEVRIGCIQKFTAPSRCRRSKGT